MTLDELFSTAKPLQTPSDKKEYLRIWASENKEHLREYGREYRERVRAEMIEAYGSFCRACGEKDPVVLVLDHRNNTGKSDIHRGGYKLYMSLKRRGWPKEDYQLLCHNCNYRKEIVRRTRDAI